MLLELAVDILHSLGKLTKRTSIILKDQMLKCRSCNSEQLISIIPLGYLPLANALLKKVSKEQPLYNLEVMLCSECNLAQLKDLVDPKTLFSDYVYFSSNSDAILFSAAELVRRIIPTLPPNAFIVEIASNDGYLLQNYHGINVLGVDPAENIAQFANSKGINTLCAFFTKDLAIELALKRGKADIIHANNVMAHVPDINGFVAGLKMLLKENGRIIVEVPHLLELIKKLEFDTIYHEHVFYFSLKAMKLLFERHGLEIYDLERLSIHGGSLRLFISHNGVHKPQPIVDKTIQAEASAGLGQIITYSKFMKKLMQLKTNLRKKLVELKSKNYSIAAYGASAKGTTLLNYCNIGKEFINFVVDRSTVKQGMYTPGTHLEILSADKLLYHNITHALLLSWNFADEIIAQQEAFTQKGGKFIIPLPKVIISP